MVVFKWQITSVYACFIQECSTAQNKIWKSNKTDLMQVWSLHMEEEGCRRVEDFKDNDFSG